MSLLELELLVNSKKKKKEHIHEEETPINKILNIIMDTEYSLDDDELQESVDTFLTSCIKLVKYVYQVKRTKVSNNAIVTSILHNIIDDVIEKNIPNKNNDEVKVIEILDKKPNIIGMDKYVITKTD